MKINSRDLIELLPKKLRKFCQFGICNPSYLSRKKAVSYYILPHYGLLRVANFTEVFPSVKSIIVLIHFTTIAGDYSVEDIIILVANKIQKRLKIHTHVLGRGGMPCKEKLIGCMNSSLRVTSCGNVEGLISLKDLAYYAGLGQYGKNSLMINNSFGSDFKIQALFAEANLEYDKPILPKAHPGCKDNS